MANFKFMEKIAEINVKHKVLFERISVILMFLSVSTTLYSQLIMQNNFKINVLVGTPILGIVTIFAIGKNKPKLTKTGVLILVILEIIGVSYLVTSLQFKVIGYMAMALVFMIGLPIVQYLLATGEEGYIVNVLTKSILISYILFFIFSLICGAPLTSEQYRSLFSNPQGLALYLIIVIPAFLYHIHRKELSDFKKNLLFVGLISAVTMSIFTSSRTGMLTVAGELLVSIIFDIITIFLNKETKIKMSKNLVKQIIIRCIIAIAVPAIMFFLFTTVKSKIEKQWPSIQIRVDEIQKSDKSTTNAMSKFGKSLNRLDGNFGKEDINGVTSGRTYIWKSFIENIGFKGHEKETKFVFSPTHHYKDPKTAHNVYIQVAYSAGIIAGISYLLLVIVSGFKIIYWIYKTLRYKVNLSETEKITAYFTIGFAMMSLVEAAYFPFMGLPATMFLILLYPIIYKISEH